MFGGGTRDAGRKCSGEAEAEEHGKEMEILSVVGAGEVSSSLVKRQYW